ncbi:hypothetical protein [Acinetobacter indicus]|uniref:hypothetical protein n=1 Tax=Acinetobacter indicus TaxID=756892 RepID=UPI0034CDAFB8
MKQLPLHRPQSQCLQSTHAVSNVYPNNHVDLLSENVITRWTYADEGFGRRAFGLIDFLKQLEHDRIRVFPKPTAAYPHPFMNSLCYFALQQISPFSYFIDLFDGFETNPYLRVFHKFAVENSQLMRVANQVPSHILENVFQRLRAELYIAKAKLQANKYEAEIQKLRNEQKTVFRRVMQTQDQANCIFLELPFISHIDPPHYQTQENAEKDSAKVLKKYFQWLHTVPELRGRLSDIHWRIVKGLDHKLTAQAFIYILGDENDYLPLLKEQWEFVCSDYQLQGIFPEPKHLHCYDGQGLVQNAWSQLIERVHEPLGFYRYKGNGITYVWKEYTGNV